VLPGGANPADFQVTNACSGAYPVASTCSITVTFSPLGAGQRTGTITISDDAPNSPQSVQLTGTGAAPPPGTPAVKLTPSSISFGTVTQGSTVTAQVITLTNSGTGTLHITSVTTGGTNAGDFSLTNNCTAPSYAVGATCTIGVSLSPIVTGARAAFITISDDAPNSPQTISISATVITALTISPAAPGSTSVTVTAGQIATFNLLLTPGSGFAGNASFTCTGAPAAATCAAPGVQLASGNPVSYAVSVATTANTIIVSPPPAPQLPPFTWLQVFALLAWYGVLVLLFYASRLQRWGSSVALRVAALVVLASFCGFEAAGCASGGASASAQVVPTPRVIGTPQGTSTITLTPSVTTSNGTPLPGVPPVQLTLTVQ